MSIIAVILGAIFTMLFLFTAYVVYLFYTLTFKIKIDHLEIQETNNAK